jgi:hypothetical protein
MCKVTTIESLTYFNQSTGKLRVEAKKITFLLLKALSNEIAPNKEFI